MFNSKRGEVQDLLMHPLFVIFVAVVVLLYLMWFINGIGEESTFEKKFLAADIALTIDSLLASKNNVVLYYLPQKSNYTPVFNYSIGDNKVIVFEDYLSEVSAGRYYYTGDPGIRLRNTFINFKEPFVLPRFARIGNELLIDDANNQKYSFNLYKLTCSGENLKTKMITLDPGHGYNVGLNKGSVGFAKGALKEFVLTRELAGMTKILDTANVIEEITREGDFELPINDRVSRAKGALISIHVGDYAVNDNFIKAYVNYDSKYQKESLRLACELVNKISSELINNGIKITGTAVIPVIPEHHDDEQLNILVKDKPAVLLEIGNINVPDTYSQKNKKVIASGIIGGIMNAF
ncbi:hypothetical protein GF358_00815 [Candidatus Woesearchaeota archaeon]|nr:hypothetical protein [Candidatus Woesearchaeota archaeon]